MLKHEFDLLNEYKLIINAACEYINRSGNIDNITMDDLVYYISNFTDMDNSILQLKIERLLGKI